MGLFVFTSSGAGVRGAAILDRPRSITNVRLEHGTSLVKKIKPDTLFSFDHEYPNGRILLDEVPNSFSGFPISPRLKEIFAEEPSIEFIPIRIQDHRKKVVATDYVLANPVGLVDCLDLAKSDVVMNALDESIVMRFKKMVLVPGKIPKDRHVFRPVGRPSMLLLSPKIVKAIEAAKITGVECVPADGFSSTNRLGI